MRSRKRTSRVGQHGFYHNGVRCVAKRKILVQLDSDRYPSAFDSIVAVDAGADHILRYGDVHLDAVRELVFGTIFTRGGSDLASTAIFIGGSNVSAGQEILKRVLDAFIGPLRVSVMLDPGGANTTASAAVLTAGNHVSLADSVAVVLGGTGPVGSRAARLLARQGATVRIVSRSAARAEATCRNVRDVVPRAEVSGWETDTPDPPKGLLEGASIVIAAGAPGVTLLSKQALARADGVKVAVDLNAVPPLGIEGIEVTDSSAQRGSLVSYGAVGVGALKMRLHKRALRELFSRNDHVLDVDQIYDMALQSE